MPIAWTKTNRQKITAIRHPHKADPQHLSFPSAQAAWSWMRARRAQNAANECTVSATPAFAPMLDTVMRDFQTETPPTIHDPHTELMRAVALCQDGGDCYPTMSTSLRALVALWMEQGGPEFVLSLFDAEANFAFLGSYSGLRSAVYIQPLEPNPHGHKHLVRLIGGDGAPFENAFWPALRAWLFAAPQAIYNHAFDIFSARRHLLLTRPPERNERDVGIEQSELDFVFSRDPIWATEDARAVLSSSAHPHIQHARILCALTDPTLALDFIRDAFIWPFDIIRGGYDILESLGNDALPIFEAYKAKNMRMDAKTTKNLEALIKLAHKK